MGSVCSHPRTTASSPSTTSTIIVKNSNVGTGNDVLNQAIDGAANNTLSQVTSQPPSSSPQSTTSAKASTPAAHEVTVESSPDASQANLSSVDATNAGHFSFAEKTPPTEVLHLDNFLHNDISSVDLTKPAAALPIIQQRPSVQARYLGIIDHDSDSESDEEEDDGGPEIITIEEEELDPDLNQSQQTIFASTGLHSISTFNTSSPSMDARSSLLASAPRRLRSLVTASNSVSPLLRNSSTFMVPQEPFFVLLVDEDERHAIELQSWLTRHRCIVTRVATGQEAEHVCQQLMENCRKARLAEQESETDSPSHTANIAESKLEYPLKEREEKEDPFIDDCADDVNSKSSIHLELDLIIADSSAFTDNGNPLLDECQNHGWLRTIPIILMSQDATAAAIDRTIRRGCADHWHKPVKRAIIRTMLKTLKDTRAQARKASLLKDWSDRFRKLVMKERKSAILAGTNPLELTATCLLTSSVKFDPDNDNRSKSSSIVSFDPPSNQIDQGSPQVVLLVGDSSSTELPRLESFLSSLDLYTYQRVEDLRQALACFRNESLSDNLASTQIITRESPTIIIVDVDSFSVNQIMILKALLDTADRHRCSRILLLNNDISTSSTSTPLSALITESYTEIDAAIQIPVPQDLLKNQLNIVTQRRRDRISNSILQKQTNQYKIMLTKVREKRAADVISHANEYDLEEKQQDYIVTTDSTSVITTTTTKRNSLPISSLAVDEINFPEQNVHIMRSKSTC